MYRICSVALLTLAVSLSLSASGGDKDKPADKSSTDKKVKSPLPAGFKDLGLSAKQKDDMHKIISDYKVKIDALTKQIADLKKQESIEVFKLLTDEQRDKYLKSKGVEPKDKK